MTDHEGTGKDRHAAAMDSMYRYQRHIYDLTRKYYLFGRDRMIEGLDVPPGGSLLEVACGTARNLKQAASRYPDARLYGFDISTEMLVSARAAFKNEDRQPVFKAVDACNFHAEDFGIHGFDRIMISYAISMIPGWEKATECALNALNPGGSLHVVDFGQQEGLPGWFKAGLQGWLEKFNVTPRADMHDVLSSHAQNSDVKFSFTSINRGYAWLAVLTRQ